MMGVKNKLAKLIFLTFVALIILCISLLASDAEKIINQIQEKYQKSSSLEIQFKEINRFKLTNTTSEVSGTFVMKGRDKYRLNSETQTIVTDGTTFWRYNKLENQVLIDHAKKENQEVFLNNFLYDLQKNYFSQLIEDYKDKDKKIYVFKLTPKPSNESFFTSIKIWVEDKSWKVRRVIYTDYNENETEYEIEKMVFDKDFPDYFFNYVPPEGIDVVDVRY